MVTTVHPQANLAINPSALKPGAAPPVKEDAPREVGFDVPVSANTLTSLQKVIINF